MCLTDLQLEGYRRLKNADSEEMTYREIIHSFFCQKLTQRLTIPFTLEIEVIVYKLVFPDFIVILQSLYFPDMQKNFLFLLMPSSFIPLGCHAFFYRFNHKFDAPLKSILYLKKTLTSSPRLDDISSVWSSLISSQNYNCDNIIISLQAFFSHSHVRSSE